MCNRVLVYGNRRRIQADIPISDSDSSSEEGDSDEGNEFAGEENELAGEENEFADGDGDEEPFEKLEKFFSDNENADTPPPGAIEPFVLEAYANFEQSMERRYQANIDVDVARDDDFTGYSDAIFTKLKLIAASLKIRRKSSCINSVASRFNCPLPLSIDEIDYLAVLNREGPFIKDLVREEFIQIRDAEDLDAALYLIKGNENRELLPIFLLSNRTIFYKLKEFGRGRFYCKVKEDGKWNDEHADIAEYEIRNDVDFNLAAGDGGETSLGKLMDGLSKSLMIVCDVDRTMVDHDDKKHHSLLRFSALWEAIYRSKSLLVFSTERSPTLYKELRNNTPLITPDITIMSLGSEIMCGDVLEPENGWVNSLNQNWDKSVVVEEASKLKSSSFSLTQSKLHTE